MSTDTHTEQIEPSPPAVAATHPLLEVQGLRVHFPLRGSPGAVLRGQREVLRAVDGVSFVLQRGETLGLVGESGCGKSSMGRAILQLQRPTAGRVVLQGQELTHLHGEALRRMRRSMQMVFQDPYASLNPRMTIGETIGEVLQVHRLRRGRVATAQRVQELLELVGLNASLINRAPHEFSGGQRQRIGIARALAAEPLFVVCDEPVSALDVSIQAQIMTLLQTLQTHLGLTYLFIAHDLSIVRHISDRVAVMYLGKLVELAPAETLYHTPMHPYTWALLSAIPIPDPQVERQRQRIILAGDVPNPLHPPSGCAFHTRCPVAIEHCMVEEPPFAEVAPGHRVACWRADETPLLMPQVARQERDTTAH